MVRLSPVAWSGHRANPSLPPRTLPLATRGRAAVSRIRGAAFGADFDERIRHVAKRYRGLDPFGLHVEAFRLIARAGAILHRLYFRTACFGMDHLPKGPAILVANHSGQLPLDGLIVASALLLDVTPGRALRVALDPRLNRMPTFLAALGRFGHVPMDRGALRALLDQGETVLVFPEGVAGLIKPYRHRYQLRPFSPEFVEVARMTGAPIVPLAVIGAEEQYINIANAERLTKLIGLPPVPVLPQWLVPGGQLPFPTRYRLHFAEPMRFAAGPANDDELAHRAWLVRQSVQHILQQGLRERRSVFW